MCSLDSISSSSTVDSNPVDLGNDPLAQDISHIVHSMILDIFNEGDILQGLRDDFSSLENKTVTVLSQINPLAEEEVSNASSASAQSSLAELSQEALNEEGDPLEFIKKLFNETVMQAFESAIDKSLDLQRATLNDSSDAERISSVQIKQSIEKKESQSPKAEAMAVAVASAPHEVDVLAPKRPMATFFIHRSKADRPLVKLTAGLIETYKHIYEVYYARKKAEKLAQSSSGASAACASKSAAGPRRNMQISSSLIGKNISISVGELFFKDRIGKGSFGEVYSGTFKAKDTDKVLNVALKVNLIFERHSETEFVKKSLMKESEALNAISRADPSLSTLFAQCSGACELDPKRFCLIQPLYGMNLYELISRTNGNGLSFKLIYKFALQLFKSLHLLRTPEINLVHFDLKPENILLEASNSAKIRIIDLGSSIKADDLKGCREYLVSRFYRAPEIILSLPYTHAVDVWSVACILFELQTGQPLFPAKNSSELLKMIYELVGPLPASVVEKFSGYERNFKPVEDKPGFYTFSKPLERNPRFEDRKKYFDRKLDFTYKSKTLPADSIQREYLSEEIMSQFKDMIMSMVAWDASCRPDPADLLEHPFMKTMEALNTLGAGAVGAKKQVGNEKSAAAKE